MGLATLHVMANPRSSQGHAFVAVLVGLTALAHGALALVPSVRPVWADVLSGLLALVALALLVVGLAVERARLGGGSEDGWLVACAGVGMVGVALCLVITLVSFSNGTGVDPWSVGALLVDALTVRIAVFTLRRVPVRR